MRFRLRRVRTAKVRLLTVVTLLLVAGCSDPGTPVPVPPPPSETAPAAALPSGGAAAAVTEADWTTYHHDNARTGAAPGFTTVTGLRKAWTAPLDGAVYGQPLVLGDTVLAGTENDTVYALDVARGAVRWSVHLGTPVRRRNLPCGNIDPLGITGTMVYDPGTGLVFAVAETTGGRHTLYGLDVATGAVRLTRVADPPQGELIAHQQRSALTLLDGRVYVAYGGLAGDCAQYIGAVVSVPTTGTGPLASYAIPTTREGGLWTPGGASVRNGRLYYAVGNGAATREPYDGSDSVIALSPGLALLDRFAPANWAADNAADLDLGSMSPAQVGGYVYITGKRGVGYVLRPDALGGIGGQVSQADSCGAFGGSAVAGDVVYLPCTDGPRAVQVDAAGTAHELWRARVAAAGSPVLGGGIWAVDVDHGALYVLDTATGAVRAMLDIGAAPHFASPTLSRGRAYIGTMTGVVAVAAA